MLLRNKEAFKFWKELGVTQIFLGLEAIDEEGLRKHRKRIPLGRNFEALEFARSLGVYVAINLIADPDWDQERFRVVRDWCMDVSSMLSFAGIKPIRESLYGLAFANENKRMRWIEGLRLHGKKAD